MPSAPALRLVKETPQTPSDAMAMLRAEVQAADLKAIALAGAVEGQRRLSRQWKTVAEILALRLGGDVTITTDEIAVFFKERRPCELTGNETEGRVRLTVGEPAPPKPAAVEAPAPAEVSEAPAG